MYWWVMRRREMDAAACMEAGRRGLSAIEAEADHASNDGRRPANPQWCPGWRRVLVCREVFGQGSGKAVYVLGVCVGLGDYEGE